MKLNEVIKVFNNQLFIAISSAAISALMGYIVSLRKEKVILRQNLEIETVDNLLNLIVDSSNKLSEIYSLNPFFIIPFHSYYDNFEHEDKYSKDLWFNIAKSNVDNLCQKCMDYYYTALKVIRFTENRSIILNKGFKVYIDEIIKLHSRLREDTDLLTEQLCRFTILVQMEDGKQITISNLENIKQSLKIIENDINLLQCLYMDFSTELQNDFIGKCYWPKRKIQSRKLQDPKYKVLYKDNKVKW